MFLAAGSSTDVIQTPFFAQKQAPTMIIRKATLEQDVFGLTQLPQRAFSRPNHPRKAIEEILVSGPSAEYGVPGNLHRFSLAQAFMLFLGGFGIMVVVKKVGMRHDEAE